MKQNILLWSCMGCGAPLDIDGASRGICRCRYCSYVNILAREGQTEEVLHYLYSGDEELSNCDFERAYNAYLRASELDGAESRAYFGMALAELKVKYVRDVVRDRWQAICYGTDGARAAENKNLLRAIELSDGERREEYARRAAEIDRVKEQFGELAAKGESYDTFICVKVTDKGDDGRRIYTQDSVIAMKLYDSLQRAGYKPFYSEKLMMQRTGEDYEALIFYALYTAKSLIVICTDESYLRTPWVQNEYSRYYAMLSEKDKEKGSITVVFDGKVIERLPGIKGKIQGVDFGSFDASERIAAFVGRFSRPEQKPERRVKLCAGCGAEVDERAKFCPECGSGEFAGSSAELIKLLERKRTAELARARDEENAVLRERERREEERRQRDAEILAERERREAEKLREREAREAEEREAREARLREEAERRVREEYEEKLRIEREARLREETERRVREEYEEKLRREYEARLEAQRAQMAAPAQKPVTDGLNTIGDNRAAEEKAREEAELRERERLEAERKLLLERARVDFELIGTVAVGIKTDKSEITVGEGITELRRGVFGRNNGFEAITLPKSLEKIGEDVFRDCSALKRITVHPENPIFESVNNCLIRRSDRTLIAGGKDAIPPDDITAIGKYAFYGRYGLEALKIPCLVSSIGEDAFRGCDKIKTMRFETKRGEAWNKSLRKIERGAFIGCTGLGINLSGYGVVCAPGSVDPERVEKWNAESFVTDKTGKYKYYEDINGNAHISRYLGNERSVRMASEVDGHKVISLLADSIPAGPVELEIPFWIEKIHRNAFSYANDIEVVKLNNTVKYIGARAFFGCKKLASINFTGKLEFIGSEAFGNCIALSRADFPDSLKTIGEGAFAGCTKLSSVSFAKMIESIPDKAFFGCSALRTVSSRGIVRSVGKDAFAGTALTLSALGIPEGIYTENTVKEKPKAPAPEAAKPAEPKKVAPTPEAAKPMDPAKAAPAPGVAKPKDDSETLYVSENVVCITAEMVNPKRKTLKRVVFAQNSKVREIDASAFQYCEMLESIEIPAGVEKIGSSAFTNCKKLKSVTLPDTVTYIGSRAFFACSALTSLKLPPKLTRVMDNLCYLCQSLSEVKLPSGLKNISDYAFYGCHNLRRIDLPASLASINKSAFQVTGITEIKLPPSLTIIEENAFGNTPLKAIVIPESVRTLGDEAFANSSLTSVTVSDKITDMGKKVFASCGSLDKSAVKIIYYGKKTLFGSPKGWPMNWFK